MSYMFDGIKNITIFTVTYFGVGYLIGNKVDDLIGDVIIPIGIFSLMEIYKVYKKLNQ